MEQPSKTKSFKHIEALLQKIPADSERHKILKCAKRFKSSWVELGEWLAKINYNRQYVHWGYNSFEDYCTKEVRIRRQTAKKLLLAYRFLERKEPLLLQKKAERPLPDYRSVDLLRQAEENQYLQPEFYNNLRNAIVEDERSHPTVAKQYREMLRSHQQDQTKDIHYKQALTAAKRLATSLTLLDGVPAETQPSLDELIKYLEHCLESFHGQE